MLRQIFQTSIIRITHMTAPVQRRHTASYYAASSLPQPDHPALQGEVVADVCVVGGGFSGLNTALELAERGMSVVLLEAHARSAGAPAGATAGS
jgi:gamma-glutamylputrescine oxidase